MTLEGQADGQEPSVDGYESPALVSYGTIEEWTHGSVAKPIIQISIVI